MGALLTTNSRYVSRIKAFTDAIWIQTNVHDTRRFFRDDDDDCCCFFEEDVGDMTPPRLFLRDGDDIVVGDVGGLEAFVIVESELLDFSTSRWCGRSVISMCPVVVVSSKCKSSPLSSTDEKADTFVFSIWIKIETIHKEEKTITAPDNPTSVSNV
jgi:hypothetical protein